MIVPSYTYFRLRKYQLNFHWRKQDTLSVFTWVWLVFIFLSCNSSIKRNDFLFLDNPFSDLFRAWKMPTCIGFSKNISEKSNYEVWRNLTISMTTEMRVTADGNLNRRNVWGQPEVNSQFNLKDYLTQGIEMKCKMNWRFELWLKCPVWTPLSSE